MTVMIISAIHSLKTEKSVSARFTLTYFNNGLKINLCQSLNYLSDYIMGITDTVIPPMNFYTNGLRVYNNISGAKMYSTDLQVMYRPDRRIQLFSADQIYMGTDEFRNTTAFDSPVKKYSFCQL